MQIKRLEPHEWQAYKTLRLEALQTEPQAFCSTYPDFCDRPDAYWQARLEEAAQGQGSWLLFAAEGSRLVGMIGAALLPEQPGTASVVAMYVTPAARGRQVARALLEAVLQELKGYGLRRAQLEVNREQGAALALYTRAGFRQTQSGRFTMGDGAEHELLSMEIEL
ncbi:MAG: GNAT family N-acetyltransferase [Chloroflexi bacterium]|nr:GNAT family N-acetyltransferase [Chloroflexota bacterium]